MYKLNLISGKGRVFTLEFLYNEGCLRLSKGGGHDAKWSCGFDAARCQTAAKGLDIDTSNMISEAMRKLS